ncbi:MAG: nucleotidyl transferase AbiEii/AbiGii toxin family protein [Thermoplasmata archaeon]
MNREELKKYLGITAYNLGHVEIDYIQHIALGALSRKWSSYLVFKGGTALQKIGMTPRFSEDLDFTEEKNISPEKISDTVIRAIESYNYPVEVDRLSDEDMTAGFRIKVQGPLFRNNKGVCSIRLEISRREEVLREPSVEEIDSPYKDVLPYLIKVMDLDEISAEKIRAILTRDKVRDVYDLYKLIEKDAVLDLDLINKKLEYYDMEYDEDQIIQRCNVLRKRWDNDLSSLMENVPDKDVAIEKIMSEVNRISNI